jgi:integrase
MRTVPIPEWVVKALSNWSVEAKIASGPIFRAINKAGRIAGSGFSPEVIWGVVKKARSKCGLANVAPHDLRRTCARLCHEAGGGAGSDPVLARPRQRAYDGAIDRVQTAAPECR